MDSRFTLERGQWDAEIWTAPAPAVLTNAVITSTQSTVGSHQSLTVTAYIGAYGVGATSQTSGLNGAPTGTVTTTRAGSVVVGDGEDWDSATSRTLGAQQTMIHEFVDTANQDAMWAQTLTAPVTTAGSAVTINDTAPTNEKWDLAVAELIPATTAMTPASTTTVRYSFTDSSDSPDWTINPAAAVGSAAAVMEHTLGLPGGVTVSIQGSGGVLTWSYPDLHGDTVVTTDLGGARQGKLAQYDPFGQPVDPVTNSIGTNNVDCPGHSAASFGFKNCLSKVGTRKFDERQQRRSTSCRTCVLSVGGDFHFVSSTDRVFNRIRPTRLFW